MMKTKDAGRMAAVHIMTREQDGQDPSSHIVNSVPRIVTFVSLFPACPLGSLFKEHQGEETRETGQAVS